jgi:hypothetical protein
MKKKPVLEVDLYSVGRYIITVQFLELFVICLTIQVVY